MSEGQLNISEVTDEGIRLHGLSSIDLTVITSSRVLNGDFTA